MKHKKRFIIPAGLVLCLIAAVLLVKGGVIYPLFYKSEIKAAAQKYQLEPELVAAVVYTESKFIKTAASGAGALGLMQIMPDTGTWIAEKQGRRDFNKNELLDAETSLDMGCWYLKYLLNEFKGNTECCIAAYHAGQGAVKRWLGSGEYSSDGRSISVYPDDSPNTEYYVTKVFKAYDYYKKLF